MVGTGPRAESASTHQQPQDENRAGTDEQVDDDVLVRQHHLQRGVQVDQVKAQHARGGHCAFQDLDVEPEGYSEQQVDREQSNPAPLEPDAFLLLLMGFYPERLEIQFLFTLVEVDGFRFQK